MPQERVHQRPREDALVLAQVVDVLRKEVQAVVRELLASGERLTVDGIVDEVLALHDGGDGPGEDLLRDEDPEPAGDSKLRELVHALVIDLVEQRRRRKPASP